MKQKIRSFFDLVFLKFLLVGAVNTLVGTGVMFGLYNLAGCNYWFSTAMNYVVGSICSYFLNKYFTFRDHTRSFKVILRFTANILVCYLIAYGVAKPLIRLIFSGAQQTVQENIAMLVGMVLFVALNYFGQRLFVFKTEQERHK